MSLVAQYSLVGVRDLDPPNDLVSGLMRAFELVKAQVPADPEGRWQRSYVLDTRFALKEWKAHTTNVLLEQWMSSSLANRVHFAKAMMWWNDQMQAARSLTAARMPPLWVLRGWLEGKAMEHRWDAQQRTWIPYDPVKEASLAKAPPLAQISDRTAQRYGLDKAEWERSANRRRF